MEQVQKIIRLDENPMENDQQVENVGGGDENDNEVSDMDKLPPEILMKILNYLDEQQLVKCRLLSSRWNEICCVLLQDEAKNNPDSKLIVQIKKCHKKNYLECTTTITKSLDSFLKCFSPSEAEKLSGRRRPRPFSRYNIQDLYYIKQTQMNKFSSLFVHIKSLFLDVKAQDIKNVEKLWNLLLKSAHNIQHLGIAGRHWLNNLKIFDLDSNSIPSSNLNVIANVNINKEDQQTVSFLQKLKFIHVKANNGFGEFDDFMKKLLKNAPNVREVVSCDPTDPRNNSVNGLKALAVLKRLGKPHLLKKWEIYYLKDSFLNEDPAELLKDTRLEYLYANCNWSLKSTENTKNYIYHAIKSSQDTLSTLHLTSLTTKSVNFLFGDIKSLPNVRNLQLEVDEEMEIGKILHRFSQLCPNTTSLDIDRFACEISDVAPVIWNGFKGLKSLKFELEMSYKKNNLLDLDSSFSGYSKEFTMKIKSRLEQGISVDEARGEEPQEASILDLKDLNRLEIDCTFYRKSYEIFNEKEEIENCLLLKILPQHIRENPMSFSIQSFDMDDSSEYEFDSDSDDPRCRYCGLRHA